MSGGNALIAAQDAVNHGAPALFTPDYYASYAEVSTYTAHLIASVLRSMGAGPALSAAATADELAQAIGCAGERQPILAWGLGFLVDQGVLRVTVRQGVRYSWAVSGPAMPTVTDPVLADGLPLLHHAAAAWPAILRGEADGVIALFRGEGLKAWERYFSPHHGLYDVHNQWGARMVADLLRPDERLLELGVGFGSAAGAVAAAVVNHGRPPREYVVSDVNLLLARRSAAALRASQPFPVKALPVDFQRDLEEQGIAPGSVDIIYACNALHCAADLPATLCGIRKALSAGGRLVLSECARSNPQSLLHQEFIFQLLDSYRKVKLLPDRPVCGFMLPDNWRSLLQAAGFADVHVVVNQASPADPVLGVLVSGVSP